MRSSQVANGVSYRPHEMASGFTVPLEISFAGESHFCAEIDWLFKADFVSKDTAVVL